MALNAKQQAFVNHYVKSRNLTKAAIAAGYSKKSARDAGSRLLTNADVKAAVNKKLEKISERAELTAADVLAEIRKLAFAKLRDAYNEDGTLKNLQDMPEDIAAALTGLESDELFAGRGAARVKIGVNRKVKMADKTRNLELLAKHFKLLTDVVEHSGKGGGPIAFIALPANGSEAPEHPSPANPESDVAPND